MRAYCPGDHRNQQYSIVGLTNAAGTLVERYTYTAYGTLGIYAANGTVRTTSTYNNRYTYTGREYDPDLKLYHFRARWYDPSTGGFVSRDPLGYMDGMSLYRGYFGVKGMDSSGRLYQSDGRPTTMDMHQIMIDRCDGKSQPNAQAKAGDKEIDENKQLQQAEQPNWNWIGLDGQLTTCDQIVNDLVNGRSANRMLSNVYSQLRKNGCAVRINCECCQPPDGGLFSPEAEPITFWDGSRKSRLIGALKVCLYSDINMPDFYIPIHIEGVLIHELTHANQKCRGFAMKSCLANLKAEMEAYYCEGSCGQGMEPYDSAVDCLFSALTSSCPNYCKSLEHWQIQSAISWFLHRIDQKNLCDFGPGRGGL